MHKYTQSTNRRISLTLKSTNLLPFSCFVRQSHPLVISFDCWNYLLLLQPRDPTPRSSAFHGKISSIFTNRASRSYKTGRKKIAEARQSPRDESFGTDFTNKCRRLNAGMSQDGSLSLNHRLPAAFLPPRPAVLLLPLRGRRFQLPSSSRRLVLPFLAPPLFRGASPPPLADANRKQERKRKAHSNWQHRQFATCLRSLPLLSPLERRLRQRQSNPPRNSPTYRSDAISMTGDVQALIRCTGFLRSGRSKN